MKFSPRLSPARAFTLLELLVVISIIAVLAGILLPVGSGVLDRAKKVDAKVTMTSIVTAVKAYQTEYGQYPVETAPAGNANASAVDTSFDTGTSAPGTSTGGRNGYLMDVLRALNNASTGTAAGSSVAYKALNSRQIVYFESKDVKNASDPRSGFIPRTPPAGTKLPAGVAAGDLVDPWGSLFCVRIDTSYSDAVVQPYPMSGTTATGVTSQSADNESNIDNLLRTPVIAWSAGKDMKFGDSTQSGKLTSSCDDVVSWQ